MGALSCEHRLYGPMGSHGDWKLGKGNDGVGEGSGYASVVSGQTCWVCFRSCDRFCVVLHWVVPLVGFSSLVLVSGVSPSFREDVC